MAKSIALLFSVYFQSFLSIDCGKTANMIVTEFPDALTVVVRQLEVRSAMVCSSNHRKFSDEETKK